MDKKVRVFDGQSRELIAVLEGHSKGIISFSWTSDGKLISGSWDGTAIVWDLTTHQIVHTLSGHENGVHVLGLSNGLVATTSTGESVNGKPANFRLRFWNVSSGQQIGDSISDHMGSIRAISGVPGIGGFATSSNDGTVILRSIDGVVIGTMYHPAQEDGSPPFVLDV